jgi:hypothetical protein
MEGAVANPPKGRSLAFTDQHQQHGTSQGDPVNGFKLLIGASALKTKRVVSMEALRK